MVEVRVSDLARSVTWYVAALGLDVDLDDAARGFALLSAGPCRLALKVDATAAGPDSTRLVFRVDDVDVERRRLIARGEAVSEVSEDPREGYRSLRVSDPDGTPIRLFSWVAGFP